MPILETGMRERIANFLPRALETALLSYHEFSEEQATAPDTGDETAKEEKVKSFKAHHDACKVAIAHIELLVKLARWADLPDPQIESERGAVQLQGLLDSANQELER